MNIKPYKEQKPWGNFTQFTKDESSTVKILYVKAKEILSLQKHQKRDEFWHVLQGDGFVTIDTEKIHAKKGDEFYVPRNTLHRIEGGENDLEILEISTGEFDEDDIIRTKDKYGRNAN